MENTFSQWLESHELSKYIEVLNENDIDSIELIKTLTVDDLKELGVSLGDRKRFGIAIDKLVSQTHELSDADLILVNSLPYVIAYPLKRTLSENHPWTRLNLFKDTFLNYLKYLGLLSASEFFSSSIKDKGMVALFHQNLTETAFGKWNHYIREVLKFLKENNHDFFCPDLLTYYEQVETGNKSVKYKGEIEFLDANGDVQLKKQEATAIGMLINFRNRYLGHGLTLDTEASERLWAEYFPIFRTLLEKMNFAQSYPMLKIEYGETWVLHSAEITRIENAGAKDENIWMQNPEGKYLSILPFFIVPGELAVGNTEKAKIFTYESYTGKTIKFFSPEGTEKQTSGKILERLNLLLRDKQKETPFSPDQFTKEIFLKRVEEENKILLDTLISEKKIILGVYQHREDMEIKLREWIGARANIFFIAAEAGSGKTNLLAEIQKQYTERGYTTLMIRAGRMEKNSFMEQIAYLLNIDTSVGFEKYASIVGTQAEPTFILIDGLNEANNAESIWQEILFLSKSVEPGCIKFVITSRANSKADIERFVLSEDENDLLYGETKESEKGLDAHVFWLTPMNMKEMKGAWERYLANDKSRYKPLFSFDDIATFDRALYEQVNNPLVLRLFLEVYNGKALPKKGGKHLHIWQDWFKTFSVEEQTFFKLLADEVWLRGENELLLDDLLKNDKLKSYISSDLVNAPYTRLKNMGWVSRYMKDMNACVGFTVEGSLLYMLGKNLQQQIPVIDLAYIQDIVGNGNKLQRSAIESFLCEQALEGRMEFVTGVIDLSEAHIDLCLKPVFLILKINGVVTVIDKILDNPTDHDWKLIIKLYALLDNLEQENLIKEISEYIFDTQKNKLVQLSSISLITLLPYLKYNHREKIIVELEKRNLDNKEYENLAFYYTFHGSPNRAVEIYIQLYNISKLDNPNLINKIACAFDSSGITDEAYKLYSSALLFAQKSNNLYKLLLPMIYYNLARLETNFKLAIEYYNKSLELEIEIYGGMHSHVLMTKSAIYGFLLENNRLDMATKIFDDIKKVVKNGIVSYETNFIIGSYNYYRGNYQDALNYYQQSLNIASEKYGDKSYELIEPLENLAYSYRELDEYQKGLECFQKIYTLIQFAERDKVDKEFNCLFHLVYFNNLLGKHSDVLLFASQIKNNIGYDIYYQMPKNKNIINYYWADSCYKLEKYIDTVEVLKGIVQFELEDISLDDYITNNELMANACFCLVDYVNAIYYYKRVLEVTDDHSVVYRISDMIGSSYENNQQFENAIQFYLSCLEIRTIEISSSEQSLKNYRIGYCFEKSKDYKNAIEYYKKGYDLDEKDYFLYQIANVYLLMGLKNESFDFSIKYLQKKSIDSYTDEIELKEFLQKTKELAVELEREYEIRDWVI
jgi:tetratricopeptide (TPR) repeat protein